MTEKRLPSSGTMAFLNLEAEDKRRTAIEAARLRLRERLTAAFQKFPEDGYERDAAKLVRGFLEFVIDNIGEYRNRTRVQNPHTGEVIEEEWVTLCGATIRALEVPDRIRRLVFELVTALLPEDDVEHCGYFAKAAGQNVQARASAADIKALQKKGILAAFSGKLLVDSKHLISEHTAGDAEAYFAAALKVAEALEETPYHTERDNKFLQLLEKSYQGGLVTMVETQQKRALAEIDNRDVECMQLEQTLRSMLDTPFEGVSSRSIEDWYISARIAFQNEAFVFARLDEFRARLKRRIEEIRPEPLLNPEAALEELTPKLVKAVELLRTDLTSHSTGLSYTAEDRLDVFQIVRSNAAQLGKKELVESFKIFISDPSLLETYARYKIAEFKRDEPDLRQKIHDDLIMWDEIFRSAPVTDDQRRRLDALREELIAPLEGRDKPLPEGLREAKMLLPFGGAILPLLRTEDEFTAFQHWLEKVHRVYNERLQSDDELPAPDPETLLRGTPEPDDEVPDSGPAKSWYPTLVDTSEIKARSLEDLTPPPGGEAPRPRPRKGWLKKWFGSD
ncbi:MAG: hypothetical protein ABI333_19065 [bacterium]